MIEGGKCPTEECLQLNPQVARADQACWDASEEYRGDVILGPSPGWNLVRAKRFWLCIYALVERTFTDQDVNKQIDPINTCVDPNHLRFVSSVVRVDKYARLPSMMELNIATWRITGVLEISYSWKVRHAGQGSE